MLLKRKMEASEKGKKKREKQAAEIWVELNICDLLPLVCREDSCLKTNHSYHPPLNPKGPPLHPKAKTLAPKLT